MTKDEALAKFGDWNFIRSRSPLDRRARRKPLPPKRPHGDAAAHADTPPRPLPMSGGVAIPLE